MEKLYTIKQAAETFGMSQALYRKAVHLKEIEYRKVGKAVRLTEVAIKKYFDKHSHVVKVGG